MFPTSPLKKRAAAQKEKSHFTPRDEFTDLNPPITYRHLLSPNQGVRDPLRVIALCDSDAFYAACEQVRLGVDPSRPLVVRQWDALIAVNYPARAFGITRMNNWRDALKKCPELIVVHVATYKEGDNAPAYWDNPDTATYKVRTPWLCGLTEYSLHDRYTSIINYRRVDSLATLLRF
jgi:DNA polymerase eta